MPIYEFKCKFCGYIFEKIKKINDERTEICPVCNNTTERLLSVPNLAFKGSGFYITDYKNTNINKRE
ncbi:MAG: zinc ribbon domain-containing protein [Patescibacteria group bacterium]|nr:zinc ribbon domain-containing protein [Patescibacteria group bacterium]